jgi:hypothetical protein
VVSTCANPGCGTRFLYLKSGRLFHFPQHETRKVDTYWLCDKCMADFRLEWRIGEGVVAVFVACDLRIPVAPSIVDREPIAD